MQTEWKTFLHQLLWQSLPLGRELKAQGKDILSFSAGEPDFDTPEIIKQAAIKAINDGHTKYTAVEGIIATKQAIINKLKKRSWFRI